ncbi:MAG: peptidylprolyl isomerase [Chloroflexi bacterium]|nr:peptidylprolyl isomerase [Chloroflexota bacterium]
MVSAQDALTPTDICAGAVPAEDPANRTFTQPEDVLEPGVDYRAVLCTEVGPVYVDLFEELTPITVNSFVFLAQQGYYNNTTFHRVIADFMAQGGDPTGTGSGGPGYQFQDELVGFLTFDVPGWLAMANAGANTNGSQFFITTAPTTHLDFQHTIFGEVLEGQETVTAIELRDPATATEDGTALQTVVIVTDPASVKTTYEDAATATQEEVLAAFEGMKETITPDIEQLLKQETVTLTTEEVAAAAPESAREVYAAFLENYGHEYRITNSVTNVGCDLENIVFGLVGYTLDSFADSTAAAAALADPALAERLTAEGYVSQDSAELTFPLFTRTDTACDKEMVRGLTFWQRGHFIATAEITIPADNPNVEFLDQALVQFVGIRIYEPVLAEILRPEIR